MLESTYPQTNVMVPMSEMEFTNHLIDHLTRTAVLEPFVSGEFWQLSSDGAIMAVYFESFLPIPGGYLIAQAEEEMARATAASN